ncbi:hypothetical protein Glove_185g29 [Diversispora epigaea]|uniref:Uncharacterized protein n=1 Tax=Diversispora epigaea TaxID=1348612 RepID=A0A397IVK4_9GLOM|nr:hypothetical protein Glove_185g29 [Diversispora epigaea]
MNLMMKSTLLPLRSMISSNSKKNEIGGTLNLNEINSLNNYAQQQQTLSLSSSPTSTTNTKFLFPNNNNNQTRVIVSVYLYDDEFIRFEPDNLRLYTTLLKKEKK